MSYVVLRISYCGGIGFDWVCFFWGWQRGVFLVNLCSNRGCAGFGVFEIGFVLRTFGVFFGSDGRFLTRIDTDLH